MQPSSPVAWQRLPETRCRGISHAGKCLDLAGTGQAGPSPLIRPGRRARGGVPSGRAYIIEQFKFEDLPPNEVGRRLRELDAKLTGKEGLFAVTQRSLQSLRKHPGTGSSTRRIEVEPLNSAPASGRVLLLVHGTFSNGENLLSELWSTVPGRDMLTKAVTGGEYAHVLLFNHFTLSAGPLLSATALSRMFRGSQCAVDVLCHSRGGLVTRWWVEMLDSRGAVKGDRGKVIFLGSPLAGTGLASPHRLKSALDLLTNFSLAMETGAQATGMMIPAAAGFATGAAFLFGMFGKALSFATGTPLLDAGVAMIPGLAGQSREGANGEILGLRSALSVLPAAERQRLVGSYHFVKANFETEDPGWKVWKYFRKDKLADTAADAVFEGANDLVVDCSSMTDLLNNHPPSKLAASQIHDFGSTPTVHHCNYLQQPETVRFVRHVLGF